MSVHIFSIQMCLVLIFIKKKKFFDLNFQNFEQDSVHVNFVFTHKCSMLYCVRNGPLHWITLSILALYFLKIPPVKNDTSFPLECHIFMLILMHVYICAYLFMHERDTLHILLNWINFILFCSLYGKAS